MVKIKNRLGKQGYICTNFYSTFNSCDENGKFQRNEEKLSSDCDLISWIKEQEMLTAHWNQGAAETHLKMYCTIFTPRKVAIIFRFHCENRTVTKKMPYKIGLYPPNIIALIAFSTWHSLNSLCINCQRPQIIFLNWRFDTISILRHISLKGLYNIMIHIWIYYIAFQFA